MLRFVYSDQGLLWDRNFKEPGRGAYVHRCYRCWSKMNSARHWEKAFRMEKLKDSERERIVSLFEETRSEITDMDKYSGHKSSRIRDVRL
jgi:predicted RNA-binding protein YlxR (DUF448 family)